MAAVEDDTSWDSETREHTGGNGNPLSHIGVQNILNCGLVCSVKKRLAPHNLQPQLHTCAHARTHAHIDTCTYTVHDKTDKIASFLFLYPSLARSPPLLPPSMWLMTRSSADVLIKTFCIAGSGGGATHRYMCACKHTHSHTHTRTRAHAHSLSLFHTCACTRTCKKT